MPQFHQASQQTLSVADRITLSRTKLGDGRTVVVRSVADGYADGATRELLNAEYTLFRDIDHPNLARVVEYRDSGAQPALVLEDPGGDFLRELLEDGPLSVRRSLELGLGLARGLSELHRHDIVHRDIRPENILVSKDHQPRIMSLARATRVTRQQAALKQADSEPSSWRYISPEQTGCPTAGERSRRSLSRRSGPGPRSRKHPRSAGARPCS
jgi:serine/threonine protein kinase